MPPLHSRLVFLLLLLFMLLISGCIDTNNSSDSHVVCVRGECVRVHNTNTSAPCFEWSPNKMEWVQCAKNISNSTLSLGS